MSNPPKPAVPAAPAPLVEGEDYVMEGPLLIFQAAYHLKRGYCCGSGCRHCPYDGVTGSTRRRGVDPGQILGDHEPK